ncbi:ABC transporter permease [Streptomyces carpinensis]|uniref:ABC transporter permease n=1 Tax=Streptomyces carpinensis TaxID=66369 RepID=A0ABV1VUP4_9ACTN|nr:ABC transporter permease [Streptomyces carpinensis]
MKLALDRLYGSRRPTARFSVPGILMANVVLIVVGTTVLGVDLFGHASLSTLTPTVGVMVLASLAQAFIIGTGGIDLSIPAQVNLVGVMLLKVPEGDSGRMPQSLLMTLVVCLAVGLVNGLVVEFMRLDSLVVTLASGLIISGITQIYRGPILAVSNVPGSWSDFAGDSVGQVSVILLLALVVTALVAAWLRFHTTARLVAAGSVSRAAAEMSGLNATRLRLTAWLVSSGIVWLAAILLAGRVRTPDMTLGDPYLLSPIVAVVLGGAALTGGRVRAGSTALGAVFLVVLDHVLRTRGYSSGVSMAFQGVVLCVGLALMMTSKGFRLPIFRSGPPAMNTDTSSTVSS